MANADDAAAGAGVVALRELRERGLRLRANFASVAAADQEISQTVPNVPHESDTELNLFVGIGLLHSYPLCHFLK